MYSFFLTTARFFRALRRAWSEQEFRGLLTILVLLLISGTIVYHHLEGWRYLDSLYFSVTTLTTIGYGDFHPVTDGGKIFTIFYVLVGIGIMLSFITILASHARKDVSVGTNMAKESFGHARKFLGFDDETLTKED